MLTVSDNEEDVVAALRSGADGYLLKDMEPEDILERLRQVSRGRLVISDNLTELLAHALREEVKPGTVDEAGLTPSLSIKITNRWHKNEHLKQPIIIHIYVHIKFVYDQYFVSH